MIEKTDILFVIRNYYVFIRANYDVFWINKLTGSLTLSADCFKICADWIEYLHPVIAGFNDVRVTMFAFLDILYTKQQIIFILTFDLSELLHEFQRNLRFVSLQRGVVMNVPDAVDGLDGIGLFLRGTREQQARGEYSTDRIAHGESHFVVVIVL